MKTLHSLIFVTCLFCSAANILAADAIEQHFGVTLGDVFEPAVALSTNALRSTTAMEQEPRQPEYAVAVTNAIKPFDNLFVQITPKTHKVYRIIARGDKVTAPEKEEVMAALQQKFPSGARATRRISVRAVRVFEDSDGKPIPQKTVTESVYTALDLQSLVAKEATEQKSPK